LEEEMKEEEEEEEGEEVEEEEEERCLCVVMPHPSGVSHVWNDPKNIERAGEVLRRAMRDSGVLESED
jgi:hypothetical protein